MKKKIFALCGIIAAISLTSAANASCTVGLSCGMNIITVCESFFKPYYPEDTRLHYGIYLLELDDIYCSKNAILKDNPNVAVIGGKTENTDKTIGTIKVWDEEFIFPLTELQ